MVMHKTDTIELEAAFREAGMHPEARGDCVALRLGATELQVKPVSGGHGRPREVRDALARIHGAGVPYVEVVVGERFTPGALDLLREEGANFLDECRFVFQATVPFIAIDRQRQCAQHGKAAPESKLGGRIGMAIQEMLLQGEDQWWGVTKLASAARVAPGTAQSALSRLEALGLLDVEGRGPNKRRRVRDRAGVLEAWVAAARRDRRWLVATYLLAQAPTALAEHVSGRLAGQRIEHAVTGASAALLVAPHVTDVRTCEVWVGPAASGSIVCAALGTAPVQKGGNVVVLRAKTDAPLYAARHVGIVRVANPLRLYADLLEDPRRGQEQASFLRETVLGF